jgi:methionyl-tRNA formyltransferase
VKKIDGENGLATQTDPPAGHYDSMAGPAALGNSGAVDYIAPMRLAMLGTGPFGAPTFRALFATHHEVAAMVTSPVRVRRGKKVAASSAMREIAYEHGVPVFDPEDVNATEARARLAEFQPDLLVVCDYGQILAAGTLACARLGGINLHGSLLPSYRGAAPINWALYHGETRTGVTVIHMTPRVDAGPCIAQAETEIGPDETAVELEQRLAELGAWLVRRAIDAIEAGRLEALPQDPAKASKAPRLKKSHGAIDWNRPAEAIRNQIRALEPWPKTFTFWHRAHGEPQRLILGPVEVVELDGKRAEGEPGTAVEVNKNRLVIAAGDRRGVSPRSVQPAGKRMLSIAEFLRGHPVQPGDRFGSE